MTVQVKQNSGLQVKPNSHLATTSVQLAGLQVYELNSLVSFKDSKFSELFLTVEYQ